MPTSLTPPFSQPSLHRASQWIIVLTVDADLTCTHVHVTGRSRHSCVGDVCRVTLIRAEPAVPAQWPLQWPQGLGEAKTGMSQAAQVQLGVGSWGCPQPAVLQEWEEVSRLCLGKADFPEPSTATQGHQMPCAQGFLLPLSERFVTVSWLLLCPVSQREAALGTAPGTCLENPLAA